MPLLQVSVVSVVPAQSRPVLRQLPPCRPQVYWTLVEGAQQEKSAPVHVAATGVNPDGASGG
ncbi:MAG TPA: hypothetical protein VES68_00355 [Candidatus Sulfotelmatobacter sp.]|nr:hypothetical protein [Candidatus Sulfotelmatobacter sp.]